MEAHSWENVLMLKQYGSGSFRGRLLTLTLFLVVIAAAVSALLPVADFVKDKPTDYEIELEQMQKDISELKERASAFPDDVETATRFVYYLYHRASLTGNVAEFKVLETAIDEAIRQLGPLEDLY